MVYNILLDECTVYCKEQIEIILVIENKFTFLTIWLLQK